MQIYHCWTPLRQPYYACYHNWIEIRSCQNCPGWSCRIDLMNPKSIKPEAADKVTFIGYIRVAWDGSEVPLSNKDYFHPDRSLTVKKLVVENNFEYDKESLLNELRQYPCCTHYKELGANCNTFVAWFLYQVTERKIRLPGFAWGFRTYRPWWPL